MLYLQKKKGGQRPPKGSAARDLFEDPDAHPHHNDGAHDGQRDGKDGGDRRGRVTGDGRHRSGQRGSNSSSGLRFSPFYPFQDLIIFAKSLVTATIA